MSYYIKETPETVKKQFGFFYPKAMEWIAEHVEDLHGYTIIFPQTSHDNEHCRFSIEIYFNNGHKVILDCSYVFSADPEVGSFYSEPTLKYFDSWSYGGNNIKIGDNNVGLYTKFLNSIFDNNIS